MLLLLARPRRLIHPAIGSLCLRQLRHKLPAPPACSRRCQLTTSATAVHVPTKSSIRFDSAKAQLRASLTELSHLNCVNQSRAQLALRCLEQDHAPVRVAVLGAPGESHEGRRQTMCASARCLRVLLADPLTPGQKWEEEFLDWSQREDAQGILLRYSPSTTPLAASPNSPLATLSFPSPFLRSHNLEILLTSLPPTQPSVEDIFVPTITVPVAVPEHESKRGARSTGMVMRYPVHKSVVFSNGLGQLFTTAGLMSRLSETNKGLADVRSVVWLPGINRDTVEANVGGTLQLLDLLAAETALDHLRATPPNPDAFQKEFLASGFGELQSWISHGTEARPYTLPSATRSLISSILKPISSSLIHPRVTAPPRLGVSADQVPSTNARNTDSVKSLTEAMKSFSTTSHQELKMSLDSAFASKLWNRKLAWYRIIFNLDNVGYLASVTLSDKVLHDTEREGWILAGRMWGAGFRNFAAVDETSTASSSTLKKVKGQTTAAEDDIARAIAAADSTSSSPPSQPEVAQPDTPFYPPFFPQARAQVGATLIPALHHAATTHVYTSASLLLTSFFTTALLYFSQLSLYTSFTASAAGAIISAGYLQRKWEREKSKFESEVREVARLGVVAAERWGWGVLRKGVEEAVRVNGRLGTQEVMLGEEGLGGGKTERMRKAVKQALEGLEVLGGK